MIASLVKLDSISLIYNLLDIYMQFKASSRAKIIGLLLSYS